MARDTIRNLAEVAADQSEYGSDPEARKAYFDGWMDGHRAALTEVAKRFGGRA